MEITISQVYKSFLLDGERIPVLNDVSLKVPQGQCTALLGPSGCGKSTLLSLIAGFYPPDSGTISTTGKVSLCMQKDMLLPWRDLLANVCLPVEVTNRNELAAAKKRAEEYLPLFGLAGFAHSYPSQLSGGMSQRAALLRTLMAGGDFWLLDEPFAKLDALTREEMQTWLLSIIQRFRPGILLITHDIDEAIRLADKIYVLSRRPASVIAQFVPTDKTDQQANIKLKEQIHHCLAESN
ncbi:MAG: ABC transporter ATP-binding protein [Firmicutes bacterium]|nr:ABC transporter ATP-binding protein [Bacillota bacterium]